MNIFDTKTYQNRREILKKSVGKGKILLLGNEHSPINYKDNYYHFRQDSTFTYYFGLQEPGLAAIIDVDNDEEIIFGNELTIHDVIWTGPLPTLVQMAEKVGIHKVLPMDKLDQYIGRRIMYLPPYRGEQAIKLHQLLGQKIKKLDHGSSMLLIRAISAQRSIKSEEEIEEMNLANTFSFEMHEALMRNARAGMKEYELVSIIQSEASRHNVQTAYPPICTVHGQILHNHSYDNTLAERRMVLVDAGLESPQGYAGDITRTFPISANFTSMQKEIYDVVFTGFTNAVDNARAGVLYRDLHLGTAKTMLSGLRDIGLVRGDLDEMIEDGTYSLFFPHGLGHMIGLDVHDMESFGEDIIGYSSKIKRSKMFGLRSLRLAKTLKEGYTLTIEPGLYFIPELIDKKRADGEHIKFVNYDKLERYRDFGGIRIEDNFVIRSDKAQLLGKGFVRTSTEIETKRYEALN